MAAKEPQRPNVEDGLMTPAEMRAFAENECVPYLLGLPRLKPHVDRLSLLLVGSVATGLCGEGSDVDIAVVCDEATYHAISPGTAWAEGRPSEITLKGVQLHYYAIPFEQIERKLDELDDVYLYVYGSAVVLSDPGGQYARRFAPFWSRAGDIRRERIEGKLDMLLRRVRALRACLADRDPLASARLCLELVTLSLKVTALLDDVPFDPRKRLFATALRGPLGRRIEADVCALFLALGDLGQLPQDPSAGSGFLARVESLARTLSDEAHLQGFRVGLAAPDRRHGEQ
jgi:predicted nucleotidyltransferase